MRELTVVVFDPGTRSTKPISNLLISLAIFKVDIPCRYFHHNNGDGAEALSGFIMISNHTTCHQPQAACKLNNTSRTVPPLKFSTP